MISRTKVEWAPFNIRYVFHKWQVALPFGTPVSFFCISLNWVLCACFVDSTSCWQLLPVENMVSQDLGQKGKSSSHLTIYRPGSIAQGLAWVYQKGSQCFGCSRAGIVNILRDVLRHSCGDIWGQLSFCAHAHFVCSSAYARAYISACVYLHVLYMQSVTSLAVIFLCKCTLSLIGQFYALTACPLATTHPPTPSSPLDHLPTPPSQSSSPSSP